MRKLWVGLFCILLSFSSRAAEISQATDMVELSAITQYDQINPNQNLGVLLKFKIKNGWHIFSQNPGEIGMPTSLSWNMPEDFKLNEIGWSQDEEFINEGFVQRGFGDTAYYQAMIVPSPMDGDIAKIEITAKWLVCGDECFPEQKTLELNLPISDLDQISTNEWNSAIEAAKPWFLPKPKHQNMWWMLFFAFIGGIIMNAMPCVFPILAIKVVAMAKSANLNSRIEALLYVAGVVISFMIIAAILLLLRQQGEQIGWGFQLQSPWFVGIMATIFILAGLLFLDVISLNLPIFNNMAEVSCHNSKLNAFFTGLVAVLVATPCTAPFMGVAVGYALSAPIYTYYPAFLSLALGYALPFALIAWFPKLVQKILPKPGKWMVVLQKICAIPVLLTALWLLWVLANQVFPKQAADVNWQEYDAKKVESLALSGQPVFVDFTAKWCLTCLMNKQTTLDSEEFVKLAKENNIALFRADWTNNDEAISKALSEYGRSSVPLYVYYNGKSPTPEMLPQILTLNIIKDIVY